MNALSSSSSSSSSEAAFIHNLRWQEAHAHNLILSLWKADASPASKARAIVGEIRSTVGATGETTRGLIFRALVGFEGEGWTGEVSVTADQDGWRVL